MFLKGLIWGLLFLLVLLAVAVSLIGFTAWGNQFAANQLAALVSTPDLRISLAGTRGLLQGDFRIDTTTLSDTKGEFARIEGLALDWSPTALLNMRFDAEKISAAKVVFSRMPVTTIEPAADDGSAFSLPVEISIGSIDLPLVALGKAIAGKDIEIVASGSAKAVADRIELDLKANEKARPEAVAAAKLAYGVNARTLNLDARISEPQGGLLARTLTLPGTPPVEIAIKGEGPLDDWTGSIDGKVSGTDVLHLAGKHARSQTGLHQLIVNGGGHVSELLPPEWRSLFAGETKVDIQAEFNAAGLIEIRAGSIANDSFAATASGKLDPNGDASLIAHLAPAGEAIDITLPLATGEQSAALRSADISLSGAFRQAKLTVAAELDRIATPDAGAEAVTIKASSPAFNLESSSGPLVMTLAIGKTTFRTEQVARLLQGPLRIDAAMDIDPALIRVEKIALESLKLGGTISGDFDLVTRQASSIFNLFVLPDAVLPPDLAAKAVGTIALSARVFATLPDKAEITDLKLVSNLMTGEGKARYDAGALTGSLRSTLSDLSLFQPNASGKIDLAIDVSGQATAPRISAFVSSAELRIAGQSLTDLDAKFDGTADPNKPNGKLSAAVTVLGQTIAASADLVSENGAVVLPSLNVKAGANTLNGALTLDKAFKPTGRIDIDLADVAALASIAQQQAAGALKGSFEITSTGETTSGVLKLAGARLDAQGVTISSPAIDVSIADLATQQISGLVRATSIASGTNALDDVALKFERIGPLSLFDLAGKFDGAPLMLAGSVEPRDGAMALNLDAFTAAPRKVPVKLSAPTTILVRDGAALIDNLVIAAGNGTIAVNGSAGKVLNLNVKIAALPASLVNAFVKDLEAEGMVSATVTIKGKSAAPVISFDADLAGASTSQTRDQGLENLDIAANGQFANNVLNADIATTLKDQPAQAAIEVKLTGGTVAIPTIKLSIGKTVLNGDLALDATGKPFGKVHFDIPDVAGLATIVGQKAEGALKGTVDFAQVGKAIKAAITSTGSLRGQPIGIKLDAVSENGALSLPALKVDIGTNTMSGAVTLDAQFQPSGSVTFDLPDLALLAALGGQKAEGALKGKADITSAGRKITTRIDATGAIRGQDVIMAVEAASDNGTLSVPALKIGIGKNTLSGAVGLDTSFMPSGKLDFDLPDIALLAAMAGQQAEGAIRGMAEIRASEGKITGTIKADGPKLLTSGADIITPVVDLKIIDLAAGQISGTVTSDRIASGANQLSKLILDFQRRGTATAFDLKSQYDGAPLTTTGSIEQQPDGVLTLNIASFSAAPKKIPVKLNAPIAIRITDGNVRFNDVSVTAGQGKITVTGSAGKALDIKAKIAALPASLANTFASGLDASGTINANVTVSGDPAAPVIAFDTDLQNASIGQIKAAGLQPMTISAKGRLAKNTLSIDTTVRNGDGLSLSARGTVGLTGAMPLSLAVNGQLPFAAAATQLAAQGIALKGDARFNLAVKGSAAKPAISGSITSNGGTLTLIRQNLVINTLAANLTLSGDQARITSITGDLAGGGTISVSGTVGFAPGLPANLKILLKNAVYVDGNIVAAKLSGDLGVNGKLQDSPVLTGRIRLARADITIPERLPGALSKIKVKHKHAPKDITVQSAETKTARGDKGARSKSGGIRLDLTIAAPRQIFVRGRGLDTELGGEVRVTGTSGDPNVAGGFRMQRGRLAILGKRLDFTTGEITFGGGMIPYLNMVASTTSSATTINVSVNGPANSPTFAFSSSPALPQDEVLAQLIFGRSSTSLSPVQIAQLADAVATLAGGQSSSLFNKLRQGLGVDDLDIGSDENGKTNVSAGKYLNKRTYLELKQGDTSKAVINLDIGKGVKLKGEAGADGSTATGIFYEKEY